MTLEAVLDADIHAYDVDMTLVDSSEVLITAFRDYATKSYGVDLAESFVREHLLAGTPEEMIGSFERVLEAQGKTLKGTVRDEVPKWRESYLDCKVRPSVYEGAIEALRLSRSLGKSVLLITSGMAVELERNTAALLACTEGDLLWDSAVCYEEIVREGRSFGKPDPYPMSIGLRKLGLNPGKQYDIAYVGDSVSDMRFAHNLGATGVLVETTVRRQDVESILGFSPLSFRDIQEYCRSLEEAQRTPGKKR